MTKLRSRFCFSLASAMFVLLCFAPGALGQGAGSSSAGSSNMILSQPVPGLVFLGPIADKRNSDRNDQNGCDARGRDNRSNKCTAVPEGGTALAYLSLVVLGCLATVMFRSRRQARLHETE
jgi:hypothetical protein